MPHPQLHITPRCSSVKRWSSVVSHRADAHSWFHVSSQLFGPNLTSFTIFNCDLCSRTRSSPHLHRRERERDLGGRSTPPVHCLLEEGEPTQVSVCEVHEAERPAPRGRRKLGRCDDSHP
eukprot:scaffold35402_cov69-Phaeocystis_antarctica.AAC.2